MLRRQSYSKLKRINFRKSVLVVLVVCFCFTQIHLLYSTWARERILSEGTNNPDLGFKKEIQFSSHFYSKQHVYSEAVRINISDGVNLHDKYISNQLYLDFYKHNRSNIQRVLLSYASFQFPEPYFISKNDRSLFYKNPENVEFGKMQNSPEKLRGEIFNIRNGTFSLPYDCGFKSSYKFVTENRNVTKDRWFFALAPMIIPEGNTFQHFIDGTLPKFIQSLQYLQKPDMKILMLKPRDEIVFELIEKLNISQKNLVFYSSGAYGADNLLFSCNTPPIHPLLWSKARKFIGAHEKRTTGFEDAKVVLMTRSGSYNSGRNILNMQETIDTLNNKYGSDNVHVFKGPYSLQKSIQLFGKTKIIIGVHGGGLYNVLFCPKDTVVIEIMPTTPDGKMLAASDRIFWAQAYLLGQKYWRLILQPIDEDGNVIVDVKKLGKILNETDSQIEN